MSTYDAVKDLPLEIDGYELEPLEREVARGFTLRRTVVVLRGGGEEGRGEEVDYDPDAQQRFQARRGELPFAGAHTLDSFSLLAVGPDRVPALGVRVGGARPRAAPGRALARRGGRARAAAAPLRRLDRGSRTSRAGARSTPSCGSSSTPTATGRDEIVATLAGAGVVDTVDFKGIYRGGVRLAAGPGALRAHRRGLPGGVDRGSGADAGDARRARAAPRPDHLGRGDPRVERRRGAAVPAALPQLEAVAVRLGASGCSTSTTRASARGSRSTAAASSSSAPAATRSSCSPRSSTPTRRTTSRRPGSTRASRWRACRRRRSHSARSRASESERLRGEPVDRLVAGLAERIPLRALARVAACRRRGSARRDASAAARRRVRGSRGRRDRTAAAPSGAGRARGRSPRAPRAAPPPRARRRSARRGRPAAAAVRASRARRGRRASHASSTTRADAVKCADGSSRESGSSSSSREPQHRAPIGFLPRRRRDECSCRSSTTAVIRTAAPRAR